MQKENSKFNDAALCDTDSADNVGVDVMEGMSSISAVIKSIEAQRSDRKIVSVYVDRTKKRSKFREIAFLERKAAELGFSVDLVSESEISEFTNGNSHGGIIAFCTRRTIPLLKAEDIKKDGVYYFLEGVEDPYNFGYAVRSLYAFGADGVILSPRNWMGVAGVVARSSAGASELLDVFVSPPEDAVRLFKDKGYKVLCAGIRDSVSILDADLKKPVFVILGGEKRGISRALLDMSDTVVRIDYGTDFNGSLSSASACAVFAFEILRSNR